MSDYDYENEEDEYEANKHWTRRMFNDEESIDWVERLEKITKKLNRLIKRLDKQIQCLEDDHYPRGNA